MVELVQIGPDQLASANEDGLEQLSGSWKVGHDAGSLF